MVPTYHKYLPTYNKHNINSHAIGLFNPTPSPAATPAPTNAFPLPPPPHMLYTPFDFDYSNGIANPDFDNNSYGASNAKGGDDDSSADPQPRKQEF